MKKNTLSFIYSTTISLLFALLFSFSSIAQTTTTPSTQKIKDTISRKGTPKPDINKLVPRVALTASTDATSIKGTSTNLLIYNTATAGVSPNNVYPGYYHNIGTTAQPNWQRIEVTVSDAVKNKQ